MPSFPVFAFSRDNVKVRFLEPTVTASLGTRFLGLPRGVYVGYTPSATAGSSILKLKPDRRLGFSCLKVGSQTEKVQVDVFTDADVELDFTGHTQFPVFVLARADYQVNVPTQGRILTRLAGPAGPQEVGVCMVDKPGADLVVTTTIPGQRQPPLAFVQQAFGYMYGGADGDLVLAQSVTNEIIDARDDIKNPGPPPAAQRLAGRLAIDLAGDHLADQLGLRCVNVVGNAKNVTAAAMEANVSASFATLTRQTPPLMMIEAGGTEAVEGAISDPTDVDRNVCFIVDDITGLRVVDSSDGPVYGRLEYLTGAVIGLLNFTNAQTVVNGVGTTFLVQLQDGDIILGADGKFYEVTARLSPTQLTISPAYQGATIVGSPSTFRRFTLRFYTRTSGGELAHSLVQAVSMRFFFPAWFRMDRSIFDGTALMKRDGERPVEPEASDVVSGRIKLAVNDSLVGAIYQISGNQIALGANNFHTLNFTAVNAAIVNAGAGVANIIVPGNPGPTGPGVAPGPPGPTGLPGKGQIANSLFQLSGIFGPGGVGSFSVTFSTAAPPLAGTLAHVCGGFARFSATSWLAAVEFRLSSISKSGNIGTISCSLGGGAKTRLFIGACI